LRDSFSSGDTLDPIEVGAALAEIPDAATAVKGVEVREVEVGDESGFNACRSLRDNGALGKRVIAGREHRGSGVVEIHVGDTGKISDAARCDDITFVFDGASLGTIADPMVAGGSIRTKGNKEDLESLHGQEATEFGELDVVADEDADFPRVCVEDAELLTSAHPPLSLFGGSEMDFSLFFDGPVAAAEVGHVVEAVVLEEGEATRDDIETAGDRLAAKEVADFLGVGGEMADRSGGAQGLPRSHERRVHIFGETDEIGTVARHGLKIEGDVIEKFAHPGHGPHCELNKTDADPAGKTVDGVHGRAREE